MALFNYLRIPLTLLPSTIQQVMHAKLSIDRIQELLNAKERISYVVREVNDDFAVTILDGSFSWGHSESSMTAQKEQICDSQKKETLDASNEANKDPNHHVPEKTLAKSSSAQHLLDNTNQDTSSVAGEKEPPSSVNCNVLSSIHLKIPKQQITAIIGPIGSGKSSLLSAVLGDMIQTSGKISLDGSIAYCPQIPWIENATLEQNILMGRPKDPKRYADALQICALTADIAILKGVVYSFLCCLHSPSSSHSGRPDIDRRARGQPIWRSKATR
jgi:ABC-type multidrug transport system fused ATPase/permease subunit